ncbi:oxygen-independent coproporphyrinogen III oxidase [Rhizobium sp. A37_96]
MSRDLTEKYGEARLPRYTSYPTAPGFSATIGPGTYSDWLTENRSDAAISLYLHIPFCRSMCWYCGCHTTITQRDQPILDYLDMLRKEIGVVSSLLQKRQKVRHIHFGGGTPTIMKPQEFIDLVALLRRCFEIGAAAEIAVEIDPRTLTDAMTEALGDAGVTRASLGVQSFDPRVQEAINRIQTAEQTQRAVTGLRNAGVESINFDLIYGLPHQTVDSCIRTVKTALGMRPNRFSVFGYAHIPAFKKHQRLIDEKVLADAAGRDAQAEAIARELVAAGYLRIGLDHYALPDDDLALALRMGRLHRNFQGYTTDSCKTLIGFGASAIGHLEQGYVQNEVAPGLYAQRIASGRFSTVKGYRLTAEDRLRAAVIERLMCDFRADIGSISRAHGFDAGLLFEGNQKLRMLEADGVVELKNGIVEVCQERRFIIRAVAAAFDAYIDRPGRTHGKAA